MQGFAAAFKLVEQYGNQGNAERGQGVEAELEGCALQTEVHEPTLDGNIIHEVNVAHAGGVRDSREPELGSLIRQKDKTDRNCGQEGGDQGRDALPARRTSRIRPKTSGVSFKPPAIPTSTPRGTRVAGRTKSARISAIMSGLICMR